MFEEGFGGFAAGFWVGFGVGGEFGEGGRSVEQVSLVLDAGVDGGGFGVVGEKLSEGLRFQHGDELGHGEFVDAAGGGGLEVGAEEVVEQIGEQARVGLDEVGRGGGCCGVHAGIFAWGVGGTRGNRGRAGLLRAGVVGGGEFFQREGREGREGAGCGGWGGHGLPLRGQTVAPGDGCRRRFEFGYPMKRLTFFGF